MTGLIEWTDGLSTLLEANPNVESITVKFNQGRLHVDRDGARFIAAGHTIDIDAALAEEAYGVSDLAKATGVEIQ